MASFPTRSLKLYNGSDALPIIDYTDDTIWEETEFGAAAYNGDAATGTWKLRDEGGLITDWTAPGRYLSAHNVVKLTVGSNTLFNGRIAARDRSRGRQTVGRAAEYTATLGDANEHLRGIIVHNWIRGAETDVARVQGLVAAYLSGSPRATTNLNGSNSNLLVVGSNTVSLPAKTYIGVTPYEILQELAETADKEMFVTVDDELAYFGHDHAGYASTFRISDDPADLNATTCVPINPSASGESRETLTALRTYWGSDQTDRTFQVTNTSRMITTDYWEDVFFDADSVNVTEAQARTNAIFAQRRLDDISLTVTIGAPGTDKGQPMSGDDIYKIKAGQLIQFKSLAARGGREANGTYSGDAFLTTRIREIVWTFTDASDQYWATLTLERPKLNLSGRGKGQPKATVPKSAVSNSTACNALAVSEMTSIAVTNGDAENGSGTQWSGGDGYSTTIHHAGARSYGFTSTADGTITYTFPSGQTFEGGKRYVIDVWARIAGTGTSNTKKFGVASGDEATDVGNEITSETGNDGNNWARHRICWTPSADRTGVRFSHRFTQTPASAFHLDDLVLYSVTEDTPEDIAETPSPGSDSCFARCDHTHGHPYIAGSTTHTKHSAASITFTPTGTIDSTDVQAAIAEVASESAGGALAQAYVGYNVVGGTAETATAKRMIVKKVTLANACLLTDIEAYFDTVTNGSSPQGFTVAVFEDNAGTPDKLLQFNSDDSFIVPETPANTHGTRWLGKSIGRWLPAGDYWIGAMIWVVSTLRFYKDGSGADRYFTSTSGAASPVVADAGFYTVTTTTDRYSIRANTIR
jgi:hypothetical protein